LLDCFGCMHPVGIDHDRETLHPSLRVGALQQGQEVTKSGRIFPRAEAMKYLAGGKIERTSKRVVFLLPWRHDFLLAPLGHPRGPNLGPQMDIECSGQDHPLMRVQALGMPPTLGQALDPLRIVIFGHQLGPFPHPAHVMEPPPDGPRGNRQAMFRLEVDCQCGTTPPRPAPAIGPWWDLEECPQRALPPGHQDGRPDGCPELALGVDSAAQLLSTIEAHNTVDAGARAEQEGRDSGRMAASSTEP